MFIDTHSHIHGPEFDADRDEVLTRARSAGVERCLAVGTDLAGSRSAIALAARRPDVYATVGVHPHEASTIDADALKTLDELAAAPRVVAYGEVGLDYYYEHSERSVQRTQFAAQIALAERHHLPLVIHTRDAWDDTFALLDEQPHHRGVFHCFTGDLAQAERALARRFFISFSGIVTFPKSQALQEVARLIDFDSILIETDCPYLSPVPFRGGRNEPARVVEIARKIAELRGIALETVAERTSANARRCFPGLV